MTPSIISQEDSSITVTTKDFLNYQMGNWIDTLCCWHKPKLYSWPVEKVENKKYSVSGF